MDETKTMENIDTLNAVTSAIDNVLDYLWEDELNNYVAEATGGAQSQGHVFESLCVLRSWVEGRRSNPEYYRANANIPDATTTGYVVDQTRNEVVGAASQRLVADVLYTTVSLIRDGAGNVTDVEVIHRCRNSEGREFGIDASFNPFC